MIGGAKGIGIGIDFGIPNQYCRATSKPYIEKDVLDSLRVVASAYGKSNDDADRSIVKNLVDASNPFIISNAAFKLNSGFGKYEVDFTSWIQTNGVIASSDKVQNSITGRFLYFNTVNKKEDVPSFKVNITLGQQSKLQYNYIKEDGTTTYIVYSESGIYTIPASYFSKYTGVNAWLGFYQIEGTSIIEQIPSFEGAFVTDGIDDLITSAKTVQEMLGGSNEITVVSMIHQIGLNCRTNFICDKGSYWRCNEVANTGEGKTGIYGYSSTNLSVNTSNIINNVLGDKVDYSVTGDRNDLTPSQFSVVGYTSSNGGIAYISSIAWYWTIIANKVLTTDQINQVIAYFNLDRTLKPDILCNTIKQGITNENHAEFGDKLIDYSGNGRDIQLNNIAWDGDSGIGKYNYPNWKVNVTQGNKYARIVYYDSINGTYSADFKGMTDLYKSYGLSVEIRVNRANTIDYHSIKEDGIYTVTPPDDTTSIDIRFGGENVYNASCDITITQIPSHAGGLCLDGVNDFGKVTGMPICKDYTVIADYIRTFAKENVQDAPILSKSKEGGDGAFIFNYVDYSTSKTLAYSFANINNVSYINDFERNIYYQSKYTNNGNSINAGTGVDTNSMWLGTYRDNVQNYFTGAIYSLMTFPYSMSEFLIERQLKKHKLGTLYLDMVEFRPVIKANNDYEIVYTAIVKPDHWQEISIGDYVTVGKSVAIQIKLNLPLEVANVSSNSLADVSFYKEETGDNVYTIYGRLLDGKSPQKINITIDEYIRFEDIVQPYPVLLRFKDENGNEVSWGGKFKVGSTITRIGSAADSNLLPNIYNIFGLLLNGNQVTSSNVIVEKTMVFKAKSTYIFDNNEPKCILSPSRLRIPNSSYKLLGYIPDISGHGNNGVIHNSAYAEGSGVNEDGSYQLDGVDDFVTIPTTVGGKQVLMKVNWQKEDTMIYNQNPGEDNFAIYANDYNNNNLVNAYASRNNGSTYIDGILNNNILATQLKDVTHNITITNENVIDNTIIPVIGANAAHNNFYAQMSLYDFMLFDKISTDDKILELNEYVGIEGNVWGILTQLSNSTLILNETLIKNE